MKTVKMFFFFYNIACIITLEKISRTFNLSDPWGFGFLMITPIYETNSESIVAKFVRREPGTKYIPNINNVRKVRAKFFGPCPLLCGHTHYLGDPA